MSRPLRTISLITLLMISLVGCGFHLSDADLDLPFDEIYISTPKPFSILNQRLRYHLRRAHVRVLNSTGRDTLVLAILTDDDTSKTISTGGNGQITRKTISKTVTYQLRDEKGRRIGTTHRVSAQRTVEMSQDQMLGSSNDKLRVQREVADACVQQLLLQLQSDDTWRVLQDAQ